MASSLLVKYQRLWGNEATTNFLRVYPQVIEHSQDGSTGYAAPEAPKCKEHGKQKGVHHHEAKIMFPTV